MAGVSFLSVCLILLECKVHRERTFSTRFLFAFVVSQGEPDRGLVFLSTWWICWQSDWPSAGEKSCCTYCYQQNLRKALRLFFLSILIEDKCNLSMNTIRFNITIYIALFCIFWWIHMFLKAIIRCYLLVLLWLLSLIITDQEVRSKGEELWLLVLFYRLNLVQLCTSNST